jgi:formyltetrahydrofolate-dependent phosphoribosylglycinamide formyltransferase
MKARLGVLVSGRGSNFRAIHQATLDGRITHGEIAMVVCNHPDAGALDYAKQQNIPFQCLPRDQFDSLEAMDLAYRDAFQAAKVDWLILAGYDRIIRENLLMAYDGRMLNIHPSLLPKYGGKGMVGHKVHEAVLANSESKSGCTVHLVIAAVDEGGILGQAEVPVLPADTPESLAARVLVQEHLLYPAVIQHVLTHGPVPMPSLVNQKG